MDNYQNTLLAEMVAHERQERILEAADKWYVTGELPQEPALRERVAELLIAVAVWLAPERQVVSEWRQLNTMVHPRAH
jgi:hypothetical protein